ncbi:MAG: type ISP restriction/modification enzyme [Pyrinomonadaceae bacterium]
MAKTSDSADAKRARIFYARVDEFARKEDKYKFLDDAGSVSGVEWQELQPDAKHTWLTEGMRDKFESLLPMGTKEAKASKAIDVESVFKNYSLGLVTNRDPYVYSFDKQSLEANVRTFIDIYNGTVDVLKRKKVETVDELIDVDDARIKWTRQVKASLIKGENSAYDGTRIRLALYRPFVKRYLYFDNFWNEELYQTRSFFPTSSAENQVIIVPSAGGRSAYWCFCADALPSLTLTSLDGSQCFPLYTYNEGGTNRRENITDWALSQFRAQYADKAISKHDIFHYVYALLHHPTYRMTYAANLKRELPRIPFVATPEDFRLFARAGERLADLHVHYETQAEYKLEHTENTEADLNWRVERMRLSKDKRSIVYNDFLTLEGIPPEAFEYRLGNRSALEWIIDQYRVSTDKRSGITNDPNRTDEPDYIVKLICKVTTVSVETVKTVQQLPALDIP